jgi:hypothetical protein
MGRSKRSGGGAFFKDGVVVVRIFFASTPVFEKMVCIFRIPWDTNVNVDTGKYGSGYMRRALDAQLGLLYKQVCNFGYIV